MTTTNSREGTRLPGTKTLSQVLKCNDPDFIDFLRQCFIWEPEKRITPDEALAHEWIIKGFPQLVIGTNQRANGSVSLEKSEPVHEITITTERNQAEMQKYFTTQTKINETSEKIEIKKSSKPGLNQSLVNTMKNAAAQSAASLAMATTRNNPETKDGGKLQDKLLQLKAKLKLMTTKTGPSTTKNADKPNDKRSLLFNVAPKKTAVDISQSKKQSLKQSNII